MRRGYPVTLVVDGRPCLVVGGGAVAARKAAGLLEAGARVTLVAPATSAEVDELAAGGLLAVQSRPYRPPEAASYRLVVAATGRPDVDTRVWADAEAAGVWVNAADDPERCSFYLPAVARRGPVSVAVATDGTSPALASWLRDRLASGLPDGVEALAELVAEERRVMKASGRSTEGVNWRGALDSDMLELIRAGEIERARERLRACL